MTTVHFVHGGSAYLPELAAYTEYLNKLGHISQIHRKAETVPDSAQVVWWMCGIVDRRQARRLSKSFHIHEYASASVGPLPLLKDLIKKWLHPRPNHRIFQSEWLRQRLRLSDNLPYTIRDMGVPQFFFNTDTINEPEFDLVYLGTMSRLNSFLTTLKSINEAGLTVLLIGEVPSNLKDFLINLKNFSCTGKILQDDVPTQLLRARAGLNLIPNTIPLSIQTSTKALEYLAIGLPIVSNKYEWITHIKNIYPNRIYLLPENPMKIDWKNLSAAIPERLKNRNEYEKFTWNSILENISIWDILDSIELEIQDS